MTVRQIVAVSTLESEIERENLKSAASAARIAQADKRGWKKAMAEIDPAPAQTRQSAPVEQIAGADEIDASNPFHAMPPE